MAQGFSLSQPQVFQCQNCREFINTSMTHCSYCGVAINAEAATAAADIQANVAKACSDANFLKIMARAIGVLPAQLDPLPSAGRMGISNSVDCHSGSGELEWDHG